MLAWRNLKSFRFEARFSTWIYRIAFNAWQSEARKQPRGISWSSMTTCWPTTGTRLSRCRTWPRASTSERAMAALSDGERAAIGACYYADLSHEEAAAALGMPLGTVKTHVLRAKAKLRARLAPRKEKDE